ncbi:MAG: peptidase S41 [Kordiimonas sp.]|nr:peptidase S41 [Kordiimonas sp.]|tara:strand:+ start:592 stop:1974 length:1383 start_codon:yes stop_codon:yes gene_type:complete
MKKMTALTGVISAFWLSVSIGTAAAHSASSETYRMLNLLGDVFEQVRSEYVNDVDDTELIEAAINGMLTSLDPHSTYLSAKHFQDMQVQTKGEFGGLGLEVTMENGVVKVVSPIDETPAARAGMMAGDYITHLDGEQVMGMTLSDAVGKMRGAVGTVIKLTVLRQGEDKPLDVEITRDVITIKSVRHRIEKEVGYVRITSFNEQTESGLKQALKDISAELDKDLQGIVLDLRNNPGGLLDQAIAVSDAFMDKGEIVSTRTRNNEKIQRYNARKGDVLKNKPIVVLINSGSASASEIVAGALQDHKRAVIVGTRSFGKGSVQTIIPLGQDGAMKLTTALYFTPSGNSIQTTGITPDILVEQLKLQDKKKPTFSMRSEASLRGRLDNPNGKDHDGTGKAEPAEPNEDTPDGSSKKEDAADSSTKPEENKKISASFTSAQNDYQLNYALNLIRGLAIGMNQVK